MKHTSFAPPARLNGFIPSAENWNFHLSPTGQAPQATPCLASPGLVGSGSGLRPCLELLVCGAGHAAETRRSGHPREPRPPGQSYGTEDPMAIDRPLPRGHCSLKSLGLIGHSCYFLFSFFSDFKFLAQLVQGKALFNNGHWVFGSVLDKHHHFRVLDTSLG